MIKLKNNSHFFLLLLFLAFLFPADSYAYLDPGSGSYFIQMTLALILGLALSIKMFWSNIKNRLKNFLSKKPEKKNAS